MTATVVAPYPEELEADVVLRDGSTVHVRPVRPSDKHDLESFFGALSVESLGLRFFSAGISEGVAARIAATVNYEDRLGLVATHGPDERIVGHALYVATDTDAVEAAFVLSDEMQGRGLGTVLLAHIAEAAGARGFQVMEAEVLPQNTRMLEVLRESGFPFELSTKAGIIHARCPVSLSPDTVQRFEQRDHLAAVAAVSHLLRPKSVAIIGASRERSRVGGAIFHNLVAGGFTGTVYPVNPHAASVQGVQAFRSLKDLPEVPELTVIAVPARAVLDVARECGDCGVEALIVVSAEFGESGPAGAKRQTELVRICRASGMRLLGPNCLGVVSTSPKTQLNATFSRHMPPRGPLALASQSGALGLAAIDRAGSRGLGLAAFVSVGNRADISPNDLLEYWEDDEDVGVIALYVESFGNPRKFARIARRVARSKPIVAVKSGRSKAGAGAIASHTGAALAASDMTVDALFRQSGVIRADTVAELLDVAALLGTQPMPRGRRVAVLTNSGGPGILCADALAAEGLDLAILTEETRDELRPILGAGPSAGNPIDMLATAGPNKYRRAMRVLARSDAVDALVVIYTPTGLDDPSDVLRGIAAGVDAVESRLPVVLVALTRDASRGLVEGRHGSAPVYPFPDDAARALGHAARRADWLARPTGSGVTLDDIRPEDAARTIALALGEERNWLEPDEVTHLLRCFGLEPIEAVTVHTPADAGAAADALCAPVALKANADGLIHKTDAGAVELGLTSGEEVKRAAKRMKRRLTANGYDVQSFLVQRMADSGIEMLVGVAHDPLFGPVVVCGAGGVGAEVLRDLDARITPLTDLDARELINSLRISPLLHGWRGTTPVDVAALEQTILRIAALVETHPEIAELDLNPVVVNAAGAFIVDARIRVEEATPPVPWPSVDAPGPHASA